jgi:hypothetical protein
MSSRLRVSRVSLWRVLGLESPSYVMTASIGVYSWLRTSLLPRNHAFASSQEAGVAVPGARAGKPELHVFVSIRVHSWFKTHLPSTPQHLVQHLHHTPRIRPLKRHQTHTASP